MKAHLIDTHLLVPRSRSSAKVKVKNQGHVSQKMGVSEALVFHKHILLSCLFYIMAKSIIIMLPKGLAYSCHFICPSICLKPFLHNCWTKLDKTSYIDSIVYCTDVVFLVFHFETLSWKKGASCKFLIFSSIGQRPASYCHGVVSVVRPFVHLYVHFSMRACVCKLFLQKTSPQKLLTGFLQNFAGMFLRWSSFKFFQIIVFFEEFWLLWRSK